ncbi:MAG TPA: hypothetical protein VKX16_15695 [Chloroflexota bacterium]|nr:hypothetical protein [Chloroflexota bacterium]
MRRLIVGLVTLALLAGPARALAAPRSLPPYDPSMTGTIVDYRLAGVEPDGDPIDQVVLKTRLGHSRGVPPLNLIISSYLENFKPDTTPILPDLLNGSTTAQNLGGFLQGKALLTDDAGDVLFIGSFVAEAFLDNTNHTVMSFFSSSGTSIGTLKGIFSLRKTSNNVLLSGSFHGGLLLSSDARRQLAAHRGHAMKPIKDIISAVTVHPAPMLGRSTKPSASAPLRTGYGGSAGTTRHINPWSIVAAAGAVVSLALAAMLFLMERRKQRSASLQ